jgi:hypothetical protein
MGYDFLTIRQLAARRGKSFTAGRLNAFHDRRPATRKNLGFLKVRGQFA